VSKEHAYAYEAGYRDGSINYELEHCPACKNVADLQEALADNAKLRELVEDMLDCIDIQIAFERVPARWMQDEFAGRARELGVDA
jgi:hypothetical protein